MGGVCRNAYEEHWIAASDKGQAIVARIAYRWVRKDKIKYIL